MKNPFKKENNTSLIAAVVIGSIAVGAITFFFLTETGKDTRKGLKKRIKSIAKNAAVDVISKRTKIKKKAVKAVADQVAKTNQ